MRSECTSVVTKLGVVGLVLFGGVGALGGCASDAGEALDEGGDVAAGEGISEVDESALDDADLAEMQVAALTSVNLVSNGGFESDFSGWSKTSPAEVSTLEHSGSKSARFSSSSGTIKRTIGGLARGTKYTLSAYVKGSAKIGARNFGGTSVSTSRSASDWTRISVSFTTGSSSTSVEVWASGGDGRVDDLELAVATASSGCGYPGQVLDLSRWKLQLPVGSPIVEIKLPSLVQYSHTPYFRSTTECAGVRLRAPTSGTTTSGSEYPRSELREMKSDGTSVASWSTTSGTHTMFIDQAVTALPKGKRHIAVGQIHNGSNDIIMVRVEGSKLLVKPNGAAEVVLDSTYSLGQRFTVKLVVSGGTTKVYYNGSATPKVSYKRSTTGAYFKAGAYTQSNCETEDDEGEDCGTDNYGEVIIYDLWVRHS